MRIFVANTAYYPAASWFFRFPLLYLHFTRRCGVNAALCGNRFRFGFLFVRRKKKRRIVYDIKRLCSRAFFLRFPLFSSKEYACVRKFNCKTLWNVVYCFRRNDRFTDQPLPSVCFATYFRAGGKSNRFDPLAKVQFDYPCFTGNPGLTEDGNAA